MKKSLSVFALVLIGSTAHAELTDHSTSAKPDIIRTDMGELDAFGVPLGSTKKSLQRMDFDTVRTQANNGNATAQFYLGKMYQMGIHTDTDINLAKSWYQKSANNGHLYAMNNLSILLMDDATDGDHEQALALLEQASANNLPHAMTNLAQHHFMQYKQDPVNNTQAHDKGMELLYKASKMGFAPADYHLYLFYGDVNPNHKTDEQIHTKRLEYLTQSANMGFAPAQLALSDYYQMNGVMSFDKSVRPLGIVQSHKWAKRACTNGIERGCDVADYFGVYGMIELEPYEMACRESQKSDKAPKSSDNTLSKCQEYEVMKDIKSAMLSI
ncbi:MAG: tetratricopeptide repeat protein [Moraxella sp.]|nr:tetratricopeptide repeat protein [Moraxella sp.]